MLEGVNLKKLQKINCFVGRSWWNIRWNQEMPRWTENDSAPHSRSVETTYQAGWSGAGEVRGAQETEASGARGVFDITIIKRLENVGSSNKSLPFALLNLCAFLLTLIKKLFTCIWVSFRTFCFDVIPQFWIYIFLFFNNFLS